MGIDIINSSPSDVDFIFTLFDKAIDYQRSNGYNLWPQFQRALIETEIQEKCHWKIVQNENVLAVFSVLYSDPVIWGSRSTDPSVYLHRIAVNPEFKGNRIMELIREWAIEHAGKTSKHFVRMDTWGNNEVLRKYYINCGFNYIGQQFLDEAEKHYGGSELSLFEIKVQTQ
jgi:predicted GNAT family N-acyltransferase